MSTNPQNSNAQSNQTGLILPYVDTDVTIKGVVTLDNIHAFMVPLATLIIALLAWSVNATMTAAISFVATLIILPTILYLTYTNPYYLSSRERLERIIESRRLQQKFPYHYHETLGRQIHGVERLYPDGTAKMTDGRRVGLIGVEGMNACRITTDEAQTYVGAFTSGIDEQIKDIPFSIYATSDTFDREQLIEHITECVEESERTNESLAGTTQATQYVRELLLDVSSWFIETESPK